MYSETQLQKSKADISDVKEYCKIYKEVTVQQTTWISYDEIFVHRVTGFSLRFAGLDLLCQDNCRCILPFLSALAIWSVTTCTSSWAGADNKGYQVTSVNKGDL